MSTLTQFFAAGQSKIDPSNVNITITGGILGLLYYKTGANEATVTPGACKDRTGLLDIQIPNDFPVAIPATANTIFHLFACTDSTVKPDTDITGATIRAADPDLGIRWIGFILTGGSGEVLKQGLSYEENHSFAEDEANSLRGAHTVDITPFVPVTKISRFANQTTSGATKFSAMANQYGLYSVGWVTHKPDSATDYIPWFAGQTQYECESPSNYNSSILYVKIIR